MAAGLQLKTKAEQRIEYLINIGRPLSAEESDELYRALHADYMRKWRQERARHAERELGNDKQHRKHEEQLLDRVLQEAGR